MMSDPASGVSVEGMLNSIISECIWGSVPAEPDKLDVDGWQMHSPVPSRDPPRNDLISYGEFLERRTTLSRPERKALKTTFTAPGSIGNACREHFEMLRAKMQLISGSSSLPCSVVPAFFKLLLVLSEQDIDYRIVFRTFGHDARSVAEEYNRFCTGTHPLFQEKGYAAPDKALDLSRGFKRLIRSASGPRLFMGIDAENDEKELAHGLQPIYRYLRESLRQNMHALSIRDDFSWWRDCGESDDSGKLLLIHPEEENTDVFQVFFDDNIERDYAHIVDVRNVLTGESIPYTESNGIYLCRVAPLEIINDESYFVKELDRILKNRGLAADLLR
eukprot:CAMPEP_0185033676 /NCGR_PEP_ID=MMETSP1103-20130426/22865_1 /TAXON_ID=36769 /ORGANISM="Paraphysomonas bandaiensis, Strain Caron Lab Isolate" /LENGTH=331 /DNA_ID=CAMNT_0027570043 /DNA_START=39 /DNA_END=1034 /DNA_ORIENTATION=-